jgi:hypothetical protein
MNIPSVSFIEMAIDSLKTLPEDVRNQQTNELVMLGPERVDRLGAHLGDDFEKGYELGIQTMRIMILLMAPGMDARSL